MDIQADIKWIQQELGKVKDPDLISIFKRLLLMRNKNLTTTIEQYNQEIENSEKDIEAGRVFSVEQIKNLNEEWKKSL